MLSFHSVEEENRIFAEQTILRSGKAGNANLCQHRDLSCVRCCLPHIGGDSHIEDFARLNKNSALSPHRYLGPGSLVMKFRNFNPLKDPRIEASQYEDCFPDVGRAEMERRFSERRKLFLEIYDPNHPRQSLPRYMKAAQENEGYRYKPAANTGIASLYIGGSVPKKNVQKGELPECQLLGFVDRIGSVGCMAHPLAETSQGFDGRDQVGFFNHTGCCGNIGCEASQEFRYLSPSALKIFDKAVEGMSWYEYSRHATSVLVYYLRAYDHILQKLDERERPSRLNLDNLVAFTNALFDEWPFRQPDRSLSQSCSEPSSPMNTLDILSTDMPLSEKILYIALDTCFPCDRFAVILQQARNHTESRIAAF